MLYPFDFLVFLSLCIAEKSVTSYIVVCRGKLCIHICVFGSVWGIRRNNFVVGGFWALKVLVVVL